MQGKTCSCLQCCSSGVVSKLPVAQTFSHRHRSCRRSLKLPPYEGVSTTGTMHGQPLPIRGTLHSLGPPVVKSIDKAPKASWLRAPADEESVQQQLPYRTTWSPSRNPSINPTIHLPTHALFIHSSIYLSIQPSIHLFCTNAFIIHPLMHHSFIHPSIHISLHPSIFPSSFRLI